MTRAQRALYDCMAKLNEEHFATRWVLGNEYDLWEGKYCTAEQRMDLFMLSMRAGGWITWDNGPVFVEREKWNQIFGKYERSKKPRRNIICRIKTRVKNDNQTNVS